MKPLVIEEEAELELVGSIAFYEERKAGLGLDFETAARQALETIVADHVQMLREQGLPVPMPNPNPTIVIQNDSKLQLA